ncbi:MAG: phosphoglucosamine mutase [Oscillospiraceae bacterium]|nr:phosphoglucosamine mutase [Oscillospiraceae bacterium]
MGRLFGTDGVRGIANKELTPELAFQIGRAGAYVLACEGNSRPKILVGKDTRISCEMLEAALIAGICSVGAEAVLVGVVPTPAIAYLVREQNADAGVVISASHNSFEHNGIKFFNGEGYKLSDEIEARIEGIILDNAETIESPIGADVGQISNAPELAEKYIKYAISTVDTEFDGLKIALDCANGAASATAKTAFTALGAEVFVINDKPNGVNINDNCGSTHMEDLAKYVKEVGADIGVAFDGDADRTLLIDENGEMVDGDKIMLMLAVDMQKLGKLKNNTLVATVMSNLGLFVAAEKLGINVLKAAVGDRYVLEEMTKGGYNIGGEQSGHVILLDYNTTGDGLVTALAVAALMKRSGKKLSELATIMQVYPQVMFNAIVSNENKAKLATDEEINRAIGAAEERFKGDGRVLVRASGTEPLIRVMIEGKDIKQITSSAKEIADLIEKKLG